MINNSRSYELFFRFIEKFNPDGFQNINPNDALIVELEKMMEKNNQFYSIADLTQVEYIFTSKSSLRLVGIEPEEFNPRRVMLALHPEDVPRLNMCRAKLMSIHKDLYIVEKGSSILSANFRMQNADKLFSDFLFQCYLFYSTIPRKTVYMLRVQTQIDHLSNFCRGYHYYSGDNLANFRYPCEKLLMLGYPFTKSEFKILQLIRSGLTNEQIADKLFLSLHTVMTHRKNILMKGEKSHISDIIFELQEQGVL